MAAPEVTLIADDGRRLTGRSLLLRSPGVAVEITLGKKSTSMCMSSVVDPTGPFPVADEVLLAVLTTVSRDALAMAQSLDLAWGPLVSRVHRRGLTLALTSPEDTLYAAADALAVVVQRSLASLGLAEPSPPSPAPPPTSSPASSSPPESVDDVEVDVLRLPADQQQAFLMAALAKERSPRLLGLLQAARQRLLPTFFDDETLTIGLGCRSATWPVDALPADDDVPWTTLGRIPVAIVTGTNGKTTTTRMVARMLEKAGLAAGYSSTDGLVVGGVVVDEGDWSGPGGARAILGDTRVQAAVLETARGGLLRRGLAIEGIDAAVVTNISSDHLGEYGVDDVNDMAQVKTLVGHAVRPGGLVVLNGGDPLLLPVRHAYVADVAHFGAGHRFHATDGSLWDGTEQIIRITDIPLTHGGRAGFNIENALAAVGVAVGLGLSREAIGAGLASLKPSSLDSPGRSIVLEKGRSRFLLDFAHNGAGVRAAMSFASQLRDDDTALVVLTGAPGDRSDDDIAAVADAIVEATPSQIIIRELDGYRRGRAPLEVPQLLASRFAERGLPSSTVADDVAGLSAALAVLKDGDVAVFLVLVQREAVVAALKAAGWLEPVST